MRSSEDLILMGVTDGFRGPFTNEPGPNRMNTQTAALLMYAVMAHQLERLDGEPGPVVIARDPRPSGLVLARAAIDAAQSFPNTRIMYLGEVPTPVAQKIGKEVGALVTYVLTASHNLEPDNGVKYMPGYSKPIPEVVRQISSRYWAQVDGRLVLPRGASSGVTIENGAAYIERYKDSVVSRVEQLFGPNPLKDKTFVVDGARGAGRNFTPEILRRLGAKRVHQFACGDGPINEACGATNTAGVEQFLHDNPDIWNDPDFVGVILNDGDADRKLGLGVVGGSNGPKFVPFDGNQMLWALATDQKQRYGATDFGIVSTEYANGALREQLMHENIGYIECPNGDLHVTMALLEMQAAGAVSWRIGGEFSGHLTDTDWLESGDGVYMAAWHAANAAVQNKTYADLAHELPLWPERLESIRFADVARLNGAMKDPRFLEYLDTVRSSYAGVRVLVRASGTEPKLRARAEARDPRILDEAFAHIMAGVHAYASGESLPTIGAIR